MQLLIDSNWPNVSTNKCHEELHDDFCGHNICFLETHPNLRPNQHITSKHMGFRKMFDKFSKSSIRSIFTGFTAKCNVSLTAGLCKLNSSHNSVGIGLEVDSLLTLHLWMTTRNNTCITVSLGLVWELSITYPVPVFFNPPCCFHVCPYCKAEGPACRGCLTVHPHAAKEEPDVWSCYIKTLRQPWQRPVKGSDCGLSHQYPCLNFLLLTHWELKVGYARVYFSLSPNHIHKAGNKWAESFFIWKWCPRKWLNILTNPGSVCLLQPGSERKKNFIKTWRVYLKKNQLALVLKVEGSPVWIMQIDKKLINSPEPPLKRFGMHSAHLPVTLIFAADRTPTGHFYIFPLFFCHHILLTFFRPTSGPTISNNTDNVSRSECSNVILNSLCVPTKHLHTSNGFH